MSESEISVPRAPEKRERSDAIMREVARRFVKAGAPSTYAEGGVDENVITRKITISVGTDMMYGDVQVAACESDRVGEIHWSRQILDPKLAQNEDILDHTIEMVLHELLEHRRRNTA